MGRHYISHLIEGKDTVDTPSQIENQSHGSQRHDHYKAAELSPEQLRKIKSLEEEIDSIIIAYDVFEQNSSR